MITPIQSTQVRHLRELVEYIEEQTDVRNSEEFDTFSSTSSLNEGLDTPIFLVRDLQVLPKTRGLPILDVRFNVVIKINTTLGANPSEQALKARAAADQINALLETRSAEGRLGITKVNRINDSASPVGRGGTLTILSQINYEITQREGEF